MKKTLIILITFALASFAFSQSVVVKNSSAETLLEINDEGTDGSSITIPSGSEPTSGTNNKLYNDGGTLKWSGDALGTAGSAGGWTDDGAVVRLSTETDNVGIGTTSPLSKLSVGGDGHADYTIYAEAAGSSGLGVYGVASNSGWVTNYGGFFTAAGSDGRGVYGEASGITGYGVVGRASGSSGRGVYGRAMGSSGQGVRGYGVAYDFYAAGPGTDYGAASSIRWKRNIVAIDKPLEKLAELRGVYFDWDEEHGGGHDVGMIAEEVGKVLPEIVVYEENGIDADGMDYSKLTPLLIEVAKAQQELIVELTERIKALESR